MIRAQATLPTLVEHVYVCVFFPASYWVVLRTGSAKHRESC